MTLKPFFTYFGGKWRAAPHYPKPEHDTIIEPFAGSAGYSLRYPGRNVVLNDLDPKVAGTWDYIINAPESEILALPLYDGTWETVSDLNLPQEARWLIGWWLNKGCAQPCSKPSTWMLGGTRPSSFWGEAIRERIASQQAHVRHWAIVNMDYTHLPAMRGTWFIDPPYRVAGKKYRHGSENIDFAGLGEWCSSRSGQVIVAENDGASWLPFRYFRDIQASPGKGRARVSREVIWTN